VTLRLETNDCVENVFVDDTRD